jgi:hypothetical protein
MGVAQPLDNPRTQLVITQVVHHLISEPIDEETARFALGDAA